MRKDELVNIFGSVFSREDKYLSETLDGLARYITLAEAVPELNRKNIAKARRSMKAIKKAGDTKTPQQKRKRTMAAKASVGNIASNSQDEVERRKHAYAARTSAIRREAERKEAARREREEKANRQRQALENFLISVGKGGLVGTGKGMRYLGNVVANLFDPDLKGQKKRMFFKGISNLLRTLPDESKAKLQDKIEQAKEAQQTQEPEAQNLGDTGAEAEAGAETSGTVSEVPQRTGTVTLRPKAANIKNYVLNLLNKTFGVKEIIEATNEDIYAALKSLDNLLFESYSVLFEQSEQYDLVKLEGDGIKMNVYIGDKSIRIDIEEPEIPRAFFKVWNPGVQSGKNKEELMKKLGSFVKGKIKELVREVKSEVDGLNKSASLDELEKTINDLLNSKSTGIDEYIDENIKSIMKNRKALTFLKNRGHVNVKKDSIDYASVDQKLGKYWKTISSPKGGFVRVFPVGNEFAHADIRAEGDDIVIDRSFGGKKASSITTDLAGLSSSIATILGTFDIKYLQNIIGDSEPVSADDVEVIDGEGGGGENENEMAAVKDEPELTPEEQQYIEKKYPASKGWEEVSGPQEPDTNDEYQTSVDVKVGKTFRRKKPTKKRKSRAKKKVDDNSIDAAIEKETQDSYVDDRQADPNRVIKMLGVTDPKIVKAIKDLMRETNMSESIIKEEGDRFVIPVFVPKRGILHLTVDQLLGLNINEKIISTTLKSIVKKMGFEDPESLYSFLEQKGNESGWSSLKSDKLQRLHHIIKHRSVELFGAKEGDKIEMHPRVDVDDDDAFMSALFDEPDVPEEDEDDISDIADMMD